jgi:hypothetical protein
MSFRQKLAGCFRLPARKSPAPTACCALPRIHCIEPSARRYLRIVIQYSLLMAVLLILILWLGAEYQEYHVRDAPRTLYLYNQSQVCTLTIHNDTATMNGTAVTTNSSSSSNKNSTNNSSHALVTMETMHSAAQAHNTPNTLVAHCGDCGQCSNPHDIDLYDDTKNTLYGDSVECAKRGLIWGRRTASKCLSNRVGFTDGCNDCWIENIMCDLKKCIFICMWYGLFSEIDSGGSGSKPLNKCTYCDEVRCGPAFVQCAGANRRRSGILSDIERDGKAEVCQVVDHEWWKTPGLQDAWRAQMETAEDASSGGDRYLRAI